MVTVDVAKVVVSRAGLLKNRWRARSFGANGEMIAVTQTYRNLADAEAAGHTFSEGAPVTIED